MAEISPTEKPGCLSLILRLFPWLRDRTAEPEALPYVRDDFLSAAEHSFYSVLKQILGEHFAICPKVNLRDVFFVRPNRLSRRDRSIVYLNKIARKHVDFLICTPKTMRPVMGIELDDKSHGRADRQERDAFVDKVFAAAGLPILHIAAARSYNTRELAVKLRPFLEPEREVGIEANPVKAPAGAAGPSPAEPGPGC